MFERFTEQARAVIVLAQEEARALMHGYIGTEHILLGLLRADEAPAARALESLGLTLELTRAQVASIVGRGESVTAGHIPFTPRAKTVLELALREALSLGHNYIGAGTSCSAWSVETRACPRGSCSSSAPTRRRFAKR